MQLGRALEASTWCDKGLLIFPQSAELHLYRSRLYAQSNALEAAIQGYRQTLRLRSGPTAARELCRLLETRVARDGLLAAAPTESAHTPLWAARREVASAFFEAGNAFNASDDYRPAEAAYASAIALAPEVADFHYSLGTIQRLLQDHEKARQSFDRAIQLQPDAVLARWARALVRNPAFSESAASAEQERQGFARDFLEFTAWWETTSVSGDQFIGVASPFYLAYQEQDNLPSLRLHGEFCSKVMQRWYAPRAKPAAQSSSNRIRLGIVSDHIRAHSVWFALIKGWLCHFDRERFEVGLFSLNGARDFEREWAQGFADYIVDGPLPLDHWLDAIQARSPSILIYPAIGLDALTWQLASLRLAPAQINSWGHPDTSGLPSMDYFVSGELFEPERAQLHYSEKLVTLPHFANSYAMRTQQVEKTDLSEFGIRVEHPVLICAGSAFKYQPIHDDVLLELVRRIENCQLVFFRQRPQALSEMLEVRLARTFRKAGLDFERHVRFLPTQSLARFHGLLESAHVYLDTIGFSGYNTVIQAIECGLPVVTQEGLYLRGRLGSGILRRLGLAELIAPSAAAYVDIAARLIQDTDYREEIRNRIRQRRALLFDEVQSVGRFQEFLASLSAG
jgi:predicted O-linked N-acetylglucosamine transferase (SPINDLY family)